jgi:Kef-type K+ transport system membrane component KefB
LPIESKSRSTFDDRNLTADGRWGSKAGWPTRTDASGEVPELHYTDLLIVVTAAMVAPLLIDLLPVPPVPTIVVEILAGILIGPQLLGLVEVDEPVRVLAQIGLVFLFFLAGLEIAFDRRRDRHLGLAAGGFGLSILLALAAAHGLRGLGLVEAPLFVAIVLAATAFGIVVAVLKDAGETGTGFGQVVIAGASIADFGTVILLSLFFSNDGSGTESTLILLGAFGLFVAVLALGLWRAKLSPRLTEAVARLQETTAQISVRIAFAVLIAFVALAEEFGLEVVLGAFLAGAIVSLIDEEGLVRRSGLGTKLEAIGFGVFIPVFFVTSGVQLQLDDLFESASTAILVPAALASLLIVRGIPALLYRRHLGDRRALAAGLLQATSLPFVVAASQIGVELGKITPATAAGLVAAGVLSVLLFPVLALTALAGRPAPAR